MRECKFRFVDEYANFKRRQIKANDMMNPGIKAEILRRVEKVMENSRRGNITLDETMRLLSMDCMTEGEDMSKYVTLSSRYASIPEDGMEEVIYSVEQLEAYYKELKAKRPTIYPENFREFVKNWVEWGFIRAI